MQERVILPILFLLASLVSADAEAVVLRVTGETADPGALAEVRIDVESPDAPLGALVFSVGFDTQKLRFDGTAKSGHQLENVSVEAPTGYITSSAVLPGTDGDTIAISLVRSGVGAPLTKGTVRLRFETWPDASGSAWVGVMPAVSAASTLGELLPVQTVDGTVEIPAPSAELLVSPSELTFPRESETGEIRLTNPGGRALTVTAIGITGNGFALESPSTPFALLPGSVAVLRVRARESGVPERGTLHVAASTPESITASVRLQAGTEEPGETEGVSSHRWILPLRNRGAATSLVLHDAGGNSEVSVLSPRQELLASTRVVDHTTATFALFESSRWIEVRSTDATLTAALIDPATGESMDAVNVHHLPTTVSAIPAVDAARAYELLLVNPNDTELTIEVTTLTTTGRELRTFGATLPAMGDLALDVLPLENEGPVTLVVRQKSEPAPFAAWLFPSSGEGTAVRMAR